MEQAVGRRLALTPLESFLKFAGMDKPPWDQRAARILVRPLAATPVRPNHITFFTLCLALAGAVLIAIGDRTAVNWGAGLFVLSRFFDHFDGELARLQATSSRFGYYFDYFVGGTAYLSLFVAMGFGFRASELGGWAILLGLLGATSALTSMVANIGIDKLLFEDGSGEAIGYPGLFGFELEDGIYLLALIAWLGWLLPFFVAASICAVIYGVWTILRLLRLRRN